MKNDVVGVVGQVKKLEGGLLEWGRSRVERMMTMLGGEVSEVVKDRRGGIELEGLGGEYNLVVSEVSLVDLYLIIKIVEKFLFQLHFQRIPVEQLMYVDLWEL